ncbi:MAG: apolipoprotein N-acyltransferase, partial [Comamonas sp.]
MNGVAVTPARQRSWPWWTWLLPLVVAGGLQAASLAWPLGGQPVWWLQILSLTVLCAAAQQARSAKHAAWFGGVFATAWLVATFWWLFISMHTYGGLPAPLAVIAVLALAAFLGSYYALMIWVWRRWALPGWQAVWLFAACWTLAELARGTLWTGFPWGAIGYAHV